MNIHDCIQWVESNRDAVLWAMQNVLGGTASVENWFVQVALLVFTCIKNNIIISSNVSNFVSSLSIYKLIICVHIDWHGKQIKYKS